MKKDLKGMSLAALAEYLKSLGEEEYRARQVFRWIYRGADSFDGMSDISGALKDKLKETSEISAIEMLYCQESRSDGTRKYLFGLSDGNAIESVFMKHKFGNSICISSQAGCRMGCVFCASGKAGLARSLSPGEMVDQMLKAQKDTGERISRVVVMGTGEPFDNYGNLAEFIRVVNDELGLGIGMRNITVSTCGVISGIQAFSTDFPQANLAVSLHAPNGSIRKGLMPTAGKQDYYELLSACREYARKTGRRVTFEYVLIGGKNDKERHADELAANLRGMLCHVNLIPVNSVSGRAPAPGANAKAERFKKRLEAASIPATVRRGLGSDIDAACGQLRLSKTNSWVSG
ncbi:MAG: 23S rRNA (adenine(2503)-C(2))-methyltransferase RlmN [Clostridiales bacterium]|nr:23S rRNA (adenine(2503)-C(2))-methyltransferase RlmN [Clostridiales bacterium]